MKLKRVKTVSDTAFYNWIKANHLTFPQVARWLNLNRYTVRSWAFGFVYPPLPIAFVIERISNGQVPVSSWLEIRYVQEVVDEMLKHVEGERAVP